MTTYHRTIPQPVNISSYLKPFQSQHNTTFHINDAVIPNSLATIAHLDMISTHLLLPLGHDIDPELQTTIKLSQCQYPSLSSAKQRGIQLDIMIPNTHLLAAHFYSRYHTVDPDISPNTPPHQQFKNDLFSHSKQWTNLYIQITTHHNTHTPLAMPKVI